MTSHFNYDQKVFVAIEINESPTLLKTSLDTYAVFRKLAIEEIKEAFRQTQNIVTRLFGRDGLDNLLEKRLKYWERLETANRTCFVHYARGTEKAVSDLYDATDETNFIQAGIYHIVPQASGFPAAFPFDDATNPWHLGHPRSLTDYSVFYFNFFPPQNFLFEKIYRTYVSFAAIKTRQGGECNQLVEIDDVERLYAKKIDQFVQINLNRFTSYDGFFHSAIQAGKHSFIPDETFTWYGMLLKLTV